MFIHFFTKHKMLYKVIQEHYGFSNDYKIYLIPKLSSNGIECMNKKLIEYYIMKAVRLRAKVLGIEQLDLFGYEDISLSSDMDELSNIQLKITKHLAIYKMLLKRKLPIDYKKFIEESIPIIENHLILLERYKGENPIDIYDKMKTELYRICWKYPKLSPILADPINSCAD